MYSKLILNWFVKFFDSNSKDIFKTFATFPQKNTLDGSEKSIFPYGTEKNIAKGITDPVHWELWLNQLFDQNFTACWSFRVELNVLIPHR